MQRGLRAGIPERGRFLTGGEHLVGHFQKLIASAVAGTPERPQGRRHHARSEVAQHSRWSRPRRLPPRASATATSSSRCCRSSRRASSSSRSTCAGPTASRSIPWEPGQFLPIRVTIPGSHRQCAPTRCRRQAIPDHYRLSIRRTKATPWSRNSCMPTPGRASAWRPWRRVAGSSSALGSVRRC